MTVGSPHVMWDVIAHPCCQVDLAAGVLVDHIARGCWGPAGGLPLRLLRSLRSNAPVEKPGNLWRALLLRMLGEAVPVPLLLLANDVCSVASCGRPCNGDSGASRTYCLKQSIREPHLPNKSYISGK